MAEREYEPQIPGVNRWNFSGKVVKKDFKYSKDGLLFGSVMLRIPSKNEKFSTVMWIKAFNSKDGSKTVAEQIQDQIQEETNWSFFGYVQNSKFEKDGETQYRTDFIVTKFAQAQADIPQVSEEKEKDKDSVPF